MTPNAKDEGPPLASSKEGPVTIVTTKDVVTSLMEGVVEATQIVGFDRTNVTNVT